MFYKVQLLIDVFAPSAMFFQILMCFCLAISNAAFGKVPRVLGGYDADIMEFPYIASIKNISNGQHICGGAIISDRHILTAAHCVFEDYITQSDLAIFVGSDCFSKDSGIMLRIENIFVHYEFTRTTDITKMRLNDIALIKVEETIKFDKCINYIELPAEDVINSKVGIFAGWGTTIYPTDITSDKLQKAWLRILDAKNCQPYMPFKVYFDQFCGFNRPGIGVCIGDSGSPLVYNGLLVGISSISVPCATGIPDLFSNVYYHLDFITEYSIL